MTAIRIARAGADDIRTIQRRRGADEATLRLSLTSADLGAAYVADDDGEHIGLCIARDSADERFIGDIYVEPSYRSAGVGNALLTAALNGAPDVPHSALVQAGDPAALSLLILHRIVPREAVLRCAGEIPKEEVLAKMAAGDYRFTVEPIDVEAHAFALNELDRHARGTARPADHATFARMATGNTFFLGGECVGYAYVWPDGRVGPLACASEAYLVQIFAYGLVTLQRKYGASWCTALVPGSNRRVARAAIRAGLRITAVALFASETEVAAFGNYVGYHELQF